MRRALSLSPILVALAACGDNVVDPAVEGVVFDDVDGDGIVDAGDEPLAGVTVWVDLNHNNVFDPTDLTAVTDGDGAYRIDLLVGGDVEVRHRVPFGYASVSGGEAAAAAARPHIIGGVETGELEYPFMASVGGLFDGEYFHFCGGALVAPSFVVTAAHCSEGSVPDEVAVVLGTNDLGVAMPRAVRAINIHPEWDGDVTTGNDIAVWQLAEPVDFDVEVDVHTVELAAADTAGLTAAGSLATTIGWGVSDNDSDGDLLQEVHLPIADDDTCGGAYPDVDSFSTQICAGVPEGGIDSCQGDSGGPLMVRDPERDVWVHAGITSWGDGCALPGKPGIYARTSALSEWARSVITERSRVHRLNIRGEVARADFGDRPALRPLVSEIDPRVQLTALTSVAGEEVPANTPVDFDFTILGDGAASGLSCSLDPDGPGPLAAAAVSCAVGDNRVTHAGYSDGAFRADLVADLGGATTRRSLFLVAGTPSSDTAAGALDSGDQTDPDFSGTYYIDYYELTGAAADVLTVLDLTVEFTGFIVLYDADVRDASGGGTLDTIFADGQQTYRFFPEPGRRYLLGISTFGEEETGAYTVELINNGTLTPVTL